MSLVLDRRSELGGDPGLHALLVGISNYPYLKGGTKYRASNNSFGLGQLNTAARSVLRIHEWLMQRYDNPAVPLATCRVLLSPSEQELALEPSLQELGDPGTLRNFLQATTEWRDDASTDRNSATFLYMAGYGFELDNHIILMEDFGDGIGPILLNAVSVASLYYGMAPHGQYPNIARTQLYFYDTGRTSLGEQYLPELASATPAFDIEVPSLDDRDATAFYSSKPGQLAYAEAYGHTLFSQALLQCLDGAAGRAIEAEGRNWGVTVSSLASTLGRQMSELAEQGHVDQSIQVNGSASDIVIHYLKQPPLVSVEVDLEPVSAHRSAHISVASANELTVVYDALFPIAGPVQLQLPAGPYLLTVQFPTQEYPSQRRLVFVNPPTARLRLSVTAP